MKKIFLLAIFCVFSELLYAQVKTDLIPPADTIPAVIKHTLDNNTAKFTPGLRTLRPIAGAPAPFYTYLWEFGDGAFSFEQEPEHTYADTGKFDIRLYATNNYDDGKRPPTRPKSVVIKSTGMMAAVAATVNIFQAGASITLKNNCMPKPGDDMIMILGYRNKTENMVQNLGGTIAMLFNDKEFSANNFELAETRIYNHETTTDIHSLNPLAANTTHRKKDKIYYAALDGGIAAMQINEALAAEALVLQNQLQNFKSSQAWHFEKLKAGETRYVFMHFKTTPQMIKDTNATVRLTGVFIPDDPKVEKEMFNVELQIVASHDPNKMSLQKTRMNYRLTGKNRELTYKVRFQNTGKGPAKKVNVGVSLSPVFNPLSIKVSKTKPQIQIGKPDYSGQSYLSTIVGVDSMHFVFNNIYLPGTQQQGVHDADSTMGFVEYKIRFKEKPKKLPIYTQASIVFDKNPAIHTNRAAGGFKMGLSPALIAGFGFPIQSKSGSYLTQKNITLGASIAPYSPYRKYLQAEIYLSDFKEASQSTSVAAQRDTTIGKQNYLITKRTHTTSSKITTLNIVPVSLRYSVNSYFGIGAGALFSVDMSNTVKNSVNYTLTTFNGNIGGVSSNLDVSSTSTKKTFSDIRASAFADVVVGLVRIGPAIGFRYFYDPKSAVSRTGAYITWKF